MCAYYIIALFNLRAFLVNFRKTECFIRVEGTNLHFFGGRGTLTNLDSAYSPCQLSFLSPSPPSFLPSPTLVFLHFDASEFSHLVFSSDDASARFSHSFGGCFCNRQIDTRTGTARPQQQLAWFMNRRQCMPSLLASPQAARCQVLPAECCSRSTRDTESSPAAHPKGGGRERRRCGTGRRWVRVPTAELLLFVLAQYSRN